MSSDIYDAIFEHVKALLAASNSKEIREAEQNVNHLAAHKGVAIALIELLQNPPRSLTRPERQHIATTLRQICIKRHWDRPDGKGSSRAEGTSQFIIPDDEKALIRDTLPSLLVETDSSIRSLISVALGEIGNREWPDVWPEFMDGIIDIIEQPLQALQSNGTSNTIIPLDQWLALDGAFECLKVVTPNIDIEIMPKFALLLTPRLLDICSLEENAAGPHSTNFIARLKAAAFDSIHDILEILVVTQHTNKKLNVKTNKLMIQMITPLLEAIGNTLSSPGWYPSVCRVKYQAFMCLNQLVENFVNVKTLYKALPIITSSVMEFAQELFQEYVRVDVEGEDMQDNPSVPVNNKTVLDAYVNETDEEGTTLESLGTCFIYYVEALATSVAERANNLVLENLPVIAPLFLAASQISVQALETWEDNPEAYYRDEADDSDENNLRKIVDDTVMSMFEVTDELGDHAITCFTTAAHAALLVAMAPNRKQLAVPEHAGTAHCVEILQPVLSGSSWKVVEASIYIVGLLAPRWYEDRLAVEEAVRIATLQKNTAKVNEITEKTTDIEAERILDPEEFASQLVELIQSNAEGVVTPEESSYAPPYILGRSLWCASRLAEMLPEEASGELLTAAADGLSPSHSLPIRLQASQSLAILMKRANEKVLEEVAPSILEQSMEMLKEAAKASHDKQAARNANKNNTDADDDNDEDDDDMLNEDDSNFHSIARLIVQIIAYAPKAAGTMESKLSPLLLALLISNNNHPYFVPLLGSGLTLLLRHKDDAVAETVTGRIIPLVTRLLSQAAQEAKDDADQNNREGGPEDNSDPFSITVGFLSLAINFVQSMIERIHSSYRRENGYETIVENTEILTDIPPAGYAPIPDYIIEPIQYCVALMSYSSQTIVGHCARVLGTAVRSFGPAILESPHPDTEPPLSLDMLSMCMSNAMNHKVVLDTAAQCLGPLSTIIMRHLLPALDADALGTLLEIIMQRLAMGRASTTQERLADAIAYAIVADQSESNDVIEALCGMEIVLPSSGPLTDDLGTKKSSPSSASSSSSSKQTKGSKFSKDTKHNEPPQTASAIAIWSRVVAVYVDIVKSPLSQRLMLAAASRVLSHRPAFVRLSKHKVPGEFLLVEDEETNNTKTKKGVKTRRQREKSGTSIQETVVPLSVRLLTKFIKTWINDIKNTYEDNEEDEADTASTGSFNDDDDDDEDEDEDFKHLPNQEADEDDDDQIDKHDAKLFAKSRRNRTRLDERRSPFVERSAVPGLDTDDSDDEDDEDDDQPQPNKPKSTRVPKDVFDLSEFLESTDGAGILREAAKGSRRNMVGGNNDDNLIFNEDERDSDPLGLADYEMNDKKQVIGDTILSSLNANDSITQCATFLHSLMEISESGKDTIAASFVQGTAAQLKEEELALLQNYVEQYGGGTE